MIPLHTRVATGRVLGFPLAAALALSLSLSLFMALPAGAQTPPLDTTIDTQLFQPAIGPRNFLTVESPWVPDHKRIGLGLTLNYQHAPYIVFTQGANPTESHLVDQQWTTELNAAMGLFGKYQIGMALPFTLYLAGDEIDAMGMPNGYRLTESGIGDLRLEGKALLATLGDDDQYTVGVSAGLTLPTGKSASRPYLGDKTVTGRVNALAQAELGPARVGANLGVLVRETSNSFATAVGPQLLYGLAAAYPADKRTDLMIELHGRSGLNQFTGFYSDVNPFEVDVAGRVAITGMWSATLGGGRGFGNGIGAPDLRLFAMAEFTPDYRDRDHDGVYDVNDKCPDQPEDRDGFQDQDGCPDPDNDGDGIPDVQDKCPNDAEDFDQFQDADGCPEPDNDGDGIPDINDACPNAPEDGKGKNPHDGCPSTTEDSDGDGIPDALDKCPDEPEDRDGFQDADGCPDPDNDADGIPDNFDNCPNDPEDPDGFQDEDGCPDPDNDQDGIPDTLDKCPLQPETLNGIKDDDGCPDPGPEIVRFAEGRIEVIPKLTFVSRGGKLQVRDGTPAKAVNDVALVMKGHPEIPRVRIEARAEGATIDDARLRAEAVRDYLVSKGVDSARLTPVGLGAGPSHVDFVIDKTPVAPAAPTGTPAAAAPGAAPAAAPKPPAQAPAPAAVPAPAVTPSPAPKPATPSPPPPAQPLPQSASPPPPGVK
jgi:hypothetical protein